MQLQVPLISLLAFILAGSSCAGELPAANQRQVANIVTQAEVTQWVFSLLIVLILFFALMVLMRKMGHLAPSTKSQMNVICGLSLGMREKLVLVKVGEKQLLLGVTPGRVDKLLVLEGNERLFQGQQTVVGDSFANKLQQILQVKSDV